MRDSGAGVLKVVTDTDAGKMDIMGGWIAFLLVAVPLLVVLVGLVLDNSIVRIMPGEVGLVLVNGTPTDRSLRPGLRFVPTVRRMAVQVYPAFELAYRAGDHEDDAALSAGLEHHGPAVDTVLGDRAAVTVAYTVRFRIDPAQLRHVHQHYGPAGLFSVVRDTTAQVVRTGLNHTEIGVADTFGEGRAALERRIGAEVTEHLLRLGFEVSHFALNAFDLGRTGQSVQAAVRARWDLERERAESDVRRERARTDGDLAPFLDERSHDLALRYREAEAWRDLAHAYTERTGALAPPGVRRTSEPSPATSDTEADFGDPSP